MAEVSGMRYHTIVVATQMNLQGVDLMRQSILAAGVISFTWMCLCPVCSAQDEEVQPVNLAVVATPSTSYVSGHETLSAINDGFEPRDSDDRRHGQYGNWPRRGTQWVEYEWQQAISTNRIDVYWWNDRRGVRFPKACRLLYWDGSNFVPVKITSGLTIEKDKYSTTTFAEVTTTRLRLEMDGEGTFSEVTWPGDEMASARPMLARVFLLKHAALALLNETLIALTDASTWLVFLALLPIFQHFVNSGLTTTVLIDRESKN